MLLLLVALSSSCADRSATGDEPPASGRGGESAGAGVGEAAGSAGGGRRGVIFPGGGTGLDAAGGAGASGADPNGDCEGEAWLSLWDNTGLTGTEKQQWLDALADRRWSCFAGRTIGYRCDYSA